MKKNKKEDKKKEIEVEDSQDYEDEELKGMLFDSHVFWVKCVLFIAPISACLVLTALILLSIYNGFNLPLLIVSIIAIAGFTFGFIYAITFLKNRRK